MAALPAALRVVRSKSNPDDAQARRMKRGADFGGTASFSDDLSADKECDSKCAKDEVQASAPEAAEVPEAAGTSLLGLMYGSSEDEDPDAAS